MRPKWFRSLWYVRRKPCTYLASRLALSLNRPNRASTWVSSPWSTIGCVQNNFWAYGTFAANRAPILQPYKRCLQTNWNEIPHDPRHLGVPLGASKMILEPIVRSAQTVHLSCVKISTISKLTESSFHLSLVTLKYHWERPKWFLSLWYVRRKPCTYLASRLALCPKGTKQTSTWASSPSGTIECVQNDFWASGSFGTKRAPILHQN